MLEADGRADPLRVGDRGVDQFGGRLEPVGDDEGDHRRPLGTDWTPGLHASIAVELPGCELSGGGRGADRAEVLVGKGTEQ